MELSQAARDAVMTAEVDGNNVRLTRELERTVYVEVDRALQAAGGKWNRGKKAHVFPDAPYDHLRQLYGGHYVDPKADRGFFATPDDLADYVVCHFTDVVDDLWPGAKVLEPSAGDGALVRAIHRANPLVNVWAVDPDARRASAIENACVTVSTLEDYNARPASFDGVVMNPPFALPGRREVWMEHVRLAYDLLTPGGRLTSIAPASTYRTDAKHVGFWEWVRKEGGYHELEPSSFRASGTGVTTVVLWVDKPTEPVQASKLF